MAKGQKRGNREIRKPKQARTQIRIDSPLSSANTIAARGKHKN
jgi:hypothetical protein